MAVPKLGKMPSEALDRIIRITRLCSRGAGADVLDPNYKINKVTVFVMCLVSIYYICVVWSMVERTGGSLTMIAVEACMAGSVIQGNAKLVVAIIYHKPVREIYYFLRDIYNEYEKKGAKYRNALYDCCSSITRVIWLMALTFSPGIILIITLPFLLKPFTGKRYLMMHFHVPGLDENTDIGYAALTCLHAPCMIVGGFGLFAGDLFILIYLSHSFVFVEIFKLKVQEINALVETVENKNDAAVTDALIDIVKWHQLFSKFTSTCNHCLYYIITVQVTVAGLSIVLTIFVVLTLDWPSGYPYLWIVFYSLYVYCILGTKIENCNDDFSYEIYNISWYEMTVPQQKIVRVMLMQSQSPQTVDVAGFLPLSVSTALQITKGIYSFTMMMVQFMPEQ